MKTTIKSTTTLMASGLLNKGVKMIKYEYISEKEIRAFSNNNKLLNEYDKNGNLIIADFYHEAINFGKIVDGVGIFDNGNTYEESEVDIPVIVEK